MQALRRKHLRNTQGAKDMTAEDEEFNRIEREASMRRKAVRAALKDHMEHIRASMTEYERGVIDGMQKQMQSSVDKAVNALSKREWVGLTEKEILECRSANHLHFYLAIQAKLKERNA
jgi:hypothetical protein